jgi:sulfate/thiosulfate transport system permease protein
MSSAIALDMVAAPPPTRQATTMRPGILNLRPSIIPGFGVTFGITLTLLSVVVLIPLSAVFIRAAGLGWDGFIEVALSERALRAYRLSFGAAAIAAVINAVFGMLTAWVLVRYRFPGRRIVSALVDLPFALPTAVAGIALTALYAPNGWIGRHLAPLGIDVAFTPLGVVIALVFVGLPFVVRTVEPVLADLGVDVEEAAASLGASRVQTFARVVLPAVAPALLTGFALAFARGVGEYGSVIFIAGNMPYRTEIAPLLIVVQLEQYNVGGATAIAVTMLVASFILLLITNLLQGWQRRRMAA